VLPSPDCVFLAETRRPIIVLAVKLALRRSLASSNRAPSRTDLVGWLAAACFFFGLYRFGAQLEVGGPLGLYAPRAAPVVTHVVAVLLAAGFTNFSGLTRHERPPLAAIVSFGAVSLLPLLGLQRFIPQRLKYDLVVNGAGLYSGLLVITMLWALSSVGRSPPAPSSLDDDPPLFRAIVALTCFIRFSFEFLPRSLAPMLESAETPGAGAFWVEIIEWVISGTIALKFMKYSRFDERMTTSKTGLRLLVFSSIALIVVGVVLARLLTVFTPLPSILSLVLLLGIFVAPVISVLKLILTVGFIRMVLSLEPLARAPIPNHSSAEGADAGPRGDSSSAPGELPLASPAQTNAIVENARTTIPALLAQSQNTPAVELFLNCLKVDPNFQPPLAAAIPLARALAARAQKGPALRLLQSTLSGQSGQDDEPVHLFLLARLLQENKQHREAIPLLEDVIKRFPRHSIATDARRMRTALSLRE
jgi:hypothetical protein